MSRIISAVSVLVPTYDEGIEFFVNVLGFVLIEDTQLSPEKRWVLVAPTAAAETRLLLAKPSDEQQRNSIGCQAGGRVFLFLRTDDFDRDYARLAKAEGVRFHGEPRHETYGTVVVFQDPFGNKWDLIEHAKPQPPT